MKYIYVVIFFVLSSISGLAQEASVQLANQYFFNGEYEKAAALFERLYRGNRNQDYYLTKYIDCLLGMEDYKLAEQVIQAHIKENPKNVQLYVTYGNLKERLSQPDEAKQQFANAIQSLPAEKFRIIQLANAFIGLAKYDFAIQTYERGKALLKDKADFSYYLAELYRRKGNNSQKMIQHYLESVEKMPARLQQIKSIFSRYFAAEDFLELQNQLFAKLQGNTSALHFQELLSWAYIQRKDYVKALRQEKAIDRRLEENGLRVFNVADIALNARDYDAAIQGYEYILKEKGSGSPYFLEAKRKALVAKRRKLVANQDFSNEELLSLESDFISFLDIVGWNKATALIIMDLAELEALYLNNLEKAIKYLEDLKDSPGLNKYIQANAKIKLADYYLMLGEIWEATLLYAQVDKAFKEELIGEEARFKNARLSYFAGDFEWAQSQFDILKTSTSKLIANDALDLSIFITDNLGLDTTAIPMQMYAQAELLGFQNRYKESLLQLDTLQSMFPNHGLQDDILYLKAGIFENMQEYDQAITAYQTIIEEYPDEIRCDNSIYNLASLYDYVLNDQVKAMELYEKLFIDYSSSTFAVEARKRFRTLRGDKVQ